MASGGVAGYAAISAKVRVLYSNLLSPQDMARLSDSPDFSSLVGALKNTQYGQYLSQLKDNEITPRRVILQLKKRLADSYSSVIQMAPEASRPVVRQMYRYFELGNLKAILRSIVTVSSWNPDIAPWDRVKDVLFPFGDFSTLPAQDMVETGNVSTAVELLKGSPYESAISFAMRRYSTEQNLFPLEVALDLDYWRQLWTETKNLKGTDREQATKIVGSLLDMNNLMWAIRYRVYHQLSEEELINYTLPFGFRVSDDDIRSLAAGVEPAGIVSRIFPAIPDVATLLENPKTGLPKLEILLKREVMKQCVSAFIGNPFHIGIPLSYLVLSDLEIQDLVVLVEAKSSDSNDEDFRSMLLKTGLVN